MKISIIGPGAIGLLYYSRLKLAGFDVYLIDYDRKRMKFLKKHGIKFTDSAGNIHSLKADVYLKPLKDTFLFINSVKAYSIEKSLRNLRKFSKTSFILSLQNGFGWENEYKKIFKRNFIRGIVLRGSTKKNIDEIIEIGAGNTIIERKNSITKGIEIILKRASLNPFAVKNFKKHLWKKFILNSSLNPVAAISGLKNGLVFKNKHLREIMIKIGKEIISLAEKEKVEIDFDIEEELKKVCFKTFDNRNSMLQDLTNNKKTEIEFLNGWILKKAKRYGLELPYNFMVYNLVKFLENRYRIKDEG